MTAFVNNKNHKELEELATNSLAFVDKNIGQLLKFIKKNLPNTCIIFLADHGDAFFEHGSFGHGHMKGLYEEIVRIPVLIHDTNYSIKKHTVGKPIRIIDIMPTILEIAKINPNKLKMDGRSLIPIVKEVEKESRVVLLESGNSHPLQKRKGEEQIGIIYDGRWKYILYKQSKKEELFDVLKDPKEKTNLVNEHRDMANKLRIQITDILNNKQSPGNYKYGSDDLKKLRALGYL